MHDAPLSVALAQAHGKTELQFAVAISFFSAREVKILERAETMSDELPRSEQPWEDVTHQFWTM
jgi:hypothetical protein